MTRYSDNIYSGYQGVVSAQTSKSAVALRKTYFVSAGAGANAIITGVFPPQTQNITSDVFVTQAGVATTNDNITLWTNGSAANGQKVLQYLAIGSAATRLNAPTYITSAAAFPQPPATNQTNGGEIPFKVIVSSVSTAAYSIVLTFNRADSNTLGVTA